MQIPSKNLELLAPGGDIEAIKAAIAAGANAVYCGLETFNARNRAKNLSFDDLMGILNLAHAHDCLVFLTTNVVILEHEIPTLFKLLNKLVNTRIDGIIVQDLGVFNLARKYFPSLDIHASTQLTTVNEGQVEFLAKIGATRLNLSRELNIDEVKQMTEVAHKHGVLTEVFVHGSLCIAFSGQCYSSSVSVGNSGNRGRCSQACRDEYETTTTGNSFPLNLKDNSAYFDLPDLVNAGVDSLKIEGRIKGAHYVYTVVDSWRKQMDRFAKTNTLLNNDDNLRKVFNRDFTNSFLRNDLTKDMFIDNPRDHSSQHVLKQFTSGDIIISEEKIKQIKDGLFADRDALGQELAVKIEDMKAEKKRLCLTFSGQEGEPLTLNISIKGSNETFTASSSSELACAGERSFDLLSVKKRFNNISSSCIVESFDFSALGRNLFISFKEITQLKHKAAYWLNDANEVLSPIDVPILPDHPKLNTQPTLSILISDEKDISLTNEEGVDVYFKLPESFKKGSEKIIDWLQSHPQLIPWFPAVLIGTDYWEAVKVLEQFRPKFIVSNNTGIAHKAHEMGIDWIAGPFLNTTNSYALLTLKEELGCRGSFISNELNYMQIKRIKRPENFKLLYSIYHPILMMTSRQCFFQQTVGCNKKSIEAACMLKCKKETTITNVKGVSFAIDKQKGGYPSIYNHQQFLNMDAVADLSGLFDEFFIDLTDIGSGSKVKPDKAALIYHFKSLISGDKSSEATLNQMVVESTNNQYKQGL